ncbi:MAG TPA: hypothetical protein DCG75_01450 [Bacteroidales bacterium]|nr:hypothetical protein [Bacteroidales bacterium]
MTRDEKYIARIILKNKFYAADKQAFEDLFTKIKQNEDSNFKQIKPQGRLGDGKCDGFNDKTGEYYQVYAPEELSGKEDKANTKMESSFNELVDYWTQNNFEVKKCYFVVNDKYRNVYASLYANAKKIATDKKIDCEILICKHLEDVFFSLDEDKVIDVLGGVIPDPLNIENVEYSIMQEVIAFLLNSNAPKINEVIPAHPDFEKKIIFNSLCKAVSDFLNAGQRQSFVIKEFFELESKFTKEELRQAFNNIYLQAVKEIPESDTKNDEIFQFIADKSSPKDNFAFHNAVYVLMAYYFEYCDIFETPN